MEMDFFSLSRNWSSVLDCLLSGNHILVSMIPVDVEIPFNTNHFCDVSGHFTNTNHVVISTICVIHGIV